jgi:hypothetical protein
MVVLWVVTPCDSVGGYRHFRGTYSLHLHPLPLQGYTESHLKFSPAVLRERETWSLALREEHRVTVFENRLLGGTYGPKTDKSHDEELHNSSSKYIIIKSRGWDGRGMRHALKMQ